MDHQQEWRATMHGERGPTGVVLAHRSSAPLRIHPQQLTRVQREEAEARLLAEGATAASGAGQRATEEAPDEFRTCFERDRDRILHSSAFRRLAGKTQVFIFPEDHQRTRLTHALEVAQVATSISRALGLNIALTEAIALGHDCGHGPGGHASEEALSPYISGGYHHAVWGADVALAPLNLCLETLDGIRNHSWSRPAPITPEGEVVSWADRFAYCTADLDDALRAGIVDASMIPPIVGERLGRRQSQQIDALVTALISCVQTTGTIGVDEQSATALAALRAFNYTYIYTRPESTAQGEAVIEVLGALVETYIAHPGLIPPHVEAAPHSEMSNEDTATRAVAYVAGMTDRFAFGTAAELLGWPASKMPVGIDLRLFAGDDADDLPVTA